MTRKQSNEDVGRQAVDRKGDSEMLMWEYEDEIGRWANQDHPNHHPHSSTSEPPWIHAHHNPEHLYPAASNIQTLPFRSSLNAAATFNSNLQDPDEEMNFGNEIPSLFDDNFAYTFEDDLNDTSSLYQPTDWSLSGHDYGSALPADYLDLGVSQYADVYNNVPQTPIQSTLSLSSQSPIHTTQRQLPPFSTSPSPLLNRTSVKIGDQSRFRRLQPLQPGMVNYPPVMNRSTTHTVTNPATRTKRGKLSVTAKEEARKVRDIGACHRCRKMKEKCDDQDPCTHCKNIAPRSYIWPCFREALDTRWKHLIPSEFMGHLELNTWKKFSGQVGHNRFIGPEFMIQLTQNFDPPLKMLVREFIPHSENDLVKDCFPIENKGESFRVQHLKLVSPPLLPSATERTWKGMAVTIVGQTKKWLNKIESDKDAQWNKTFFPEQYGQALPRELLGDICNFFHTVMHQSCTALKTVLKTTVILYMVGHIFYIPEEQVKGVLGRLNCAAQLPEEYSEFVCPRLCDRFIKMVLFPQLRKGLQHSFTRLQALYESDGRKATLLNRDRYLATTIVLLIIAGTLQAKAMEKAFTQLRQGEISNLEDALVQVREIEELVVEQLFIFWSHKFSVENELSVKVEPSDRHYYSRAETYNLFKRFQLSYGRHSKELDDLDPELPQHPQKETFSAININRLMKKFYIRVFHQGVSWDKRDDD